MIAVDTCILIWGVREHSQAGREDMIVRCKRLIDDHKARRIPIMVPAIVLAEYLARFDADEQLKQRETIARNFFVAPFDNEGDLAGCAHSLTKTAFAPSKPMAPPSSASTPT